MRILQIVPSIALVYGGPSQMVRGLSAWQALAGAQVTILTTNLNGDRGEAPLDVPVDHGVQEEGYEIHYFPCIPIHRYKVSLQLLVWLLRHGKDYDIAHIHALFSPISTLAAIICRCIGLPYWLRPLGTLDPMDLKKKRFLKGIYGWLLERGNIAGAAALHFTSEEEARVSKRFGTKTPAVVIPVGVRLPDRLPARTHPKLSSVFRSPAPPARMDAPEISGGKSRAELEPTQSQEIPLLLYMSRIAPKKGLDLLLPALESLAQEGVPFRFVLAGSNPQDPVYEQTIDELILRSPWLRDRTQITGFISGQRKQEILGNADVFVLPSYYENFGLAVAESMAAGIPVVISRGVHIWPTVARAEAGWICDRDQETLTVVLREALTHPQLRKKRGKNARQCAAKNYRWSDIARHTLKAYHQSIREQRRASRSK
ncbi:MAG: hormogonium polysaccharide biosynthesis glycosyltransferase HpsP [Cyanobacteria bacterium P01_C01_bin.89]